MNADAFNFFSDPAFREWLVGTFVIWNVAYACKLLKKNI